MAQDVKRGLNRRKIFTAEATGRLAKSKRKCGANTTGKIMTTGSISAKNIIE